jgi:hypothetical protein
MSLAGCPGVAWDSQLGKTADVAGTTADASARPVSSTVVVSVTRSVHHSPFAWQPSMLRRAWQVAQPESDVPTHVVSRIALTAWAIMMGFASLLAGAVALSVRLAPHAPRRSTESTPAADATRRTLGTPARLANLAPSVIFADASTLSYHTSLADDVPDIQDVLRPGSTGRRPADASIAVHTAVGACLTSDDDGSTHDHELTVTWFFAADSGAPHGSGEYVLWEQRNDSTPVALVRHVLRDGRRPFLDYQYVVPSGDGADSIAIVPRTMLPISRADTVSTPVDVRALRAVEWHFLVILDATVHPAHMARVHVLTSLPAIDRLDRHECRASVKRQPILAEYAAPTSELRG